MLLPHHAGKAFGAPFTRKNLISHAGILTGLPMPWLALILYAGGLIGATAGFIGYLYSVLGFPLIDAPTS